MPVVANETVRIGDRREMVTRGRVYDDDDPIVKSHPQFFDTVDEAAVKAQPKDDTDKLGERSMLARNKNAPVEQATAAPGEKRRTRRSK